MNNLITALRNLERTAYTSGDLLIEGTAGYDYTPEEGKALSKLMGNLMGIESECRRLQDELTKAQRLLSKVSSRVDGAKDDASMTRHHLSTIEDEGPHSDFIGDTLYLADTTAEGVEYALTQAAEAIEEVYKLW